MTDYVVPMGVEQLVHKLQEAVAPPSPGTAAWFDWQTLPLSSFYNGMNLVREQLGPGRHRFVDVGSGIGTKLFLADTLGFEPTGIEHNPDYINVSEQLFPEYRVWHGNALEFTDYSKFDVVYSYRCARSDELQHELNALIINNMKNGAVFFSTDTNDSVDLAIDMPGVQGEKL